MEFYQITTGLSSKSELRYRLQWFIRIRWVYFAIMASVGLAGQYLALGAIQSVYQDAWLAAVALASNIVAWALARLTLQNELFYRVVAGLMLATDIVVVTYGMLRHGGAISPLVLIFAIPIIVAAVFGRFVLYTTAAFAALCYSFVIVMDNLGRVSHLSTEAALLAGPLSHALVLVAFYLAILMLAAVVANYATNVVKLQEQERAMAELMALISHQLMTPASSVKGFLSLLLESHYGKLSPPQRQALQEAFAENEKEVKLIQDILDVARVESGRMGLDKTKIELTSMLDNVVAGQMGAIKGRQQTVSVDLPPTTLEVWADGDLLHSAITNLVNNASKFSRRGDKIKVRLRELKDGIVVEVADTGMGIPQQDLPKLFKKFSRIVPTRSLPSEGTGLGLYLTKRIIELHNGSIDVSSREGRGTTFTIKLPKE